MPALFAPVVDDVTRRRFLVALGAAGLPQAESGGFAATLGPAADGMVSVGVTGEADLEQVAALAPDLIFHATDHQDIAADTLAAIAPVIVYPRASTGLFAPLRGLGGLVGRDDRAAELERELLAAFAAA